MELDIFSQQISSSEITEVVKTDVVIIGAGNAGLIAAVSSAEQHNKTVLLQKLPRFRGAGHWIGAVNSRLQNKLGININRDEIIAEICRWATYRNDQRVVTEWADRSGEVIDWLEELVKPEGFELGLESDVKEGFYKSYPIGHFFKRQGKVLKRGESYLYVLEKKALDCGTNIHYKTPAIQLIRHGNDQITGVIAQNSEGKYFQFNVKKGVIICSGGYQQNVEMLRKYCPRALYASDSPSLMVPGNTGDGIEMGLQIGAAIDELPHAPMQFDLGAPTDGTGYPWTGIGGIPEKFNMLRQPWLRVNTHGERYVNEDLPYSYNLNAAAQQPGHVWWTVWDADWKSSIKRFHTTLCARIIPIPEAGGGSSLEKMQENLEQLIKRDLVKKADSIEDLARIMQVPTAAFKTTVERYNMLAKIGEDVDFGKIQSRFSTMENPPFYALKGAASFLVTINGLRINKKMQVLDSDLNGIPGLYAAGDVSGSFFANDYPQLCGGLALGRALTFGRLAGLNVAAEP